MQEILPDCVEKNIKVLSNAGGVNVEGCAEAIKKAAQDLGLSGKVKIGVVTGDDVLPRLQEFLEKGVEINNMDTGEPLSEILDKVQSANVYLGAEPLGRSLGKRSADHCRRTTDRYGFDARAFDARIRLEIWRLGQGGDRNDCRTYYRMRRTVFGRKLSIRLAEYSRYGERRFPDCRSLSEAANSSSRNTKARADASIFPRSKNSFCTKWAIRIDISRPMSWRILRRFILTDDGENRVRVYGIKGKQNTEFYKVSIAYSAGWKAVGTLVYSYPDAFEKAQSGGQNSSRTFGKIRFEIRCDPDGICRLERDARASFGRAAERYSRNPTAFRRARSKQRRC